MMITLGIFKNQMGENGLFLLHFGYSTVNNQNRLVWLCHAILLVVC